LADVQKSPTIPGRQGPEDIGPISVVHQLVVKPGCLAAAHRLMTQDYPDSLAPYGVRLKSVLCSPVEPPGQPTDLLVILEYENAAMFWVERSGTMRNAADAATLWEKIDQLVVRRERKLLTPEPVSWPPPTPETSSPRLSPNLHQTTLILKPAAPLNASEQAAWLSAIDAFTTGNPEVSASGAGFHIIAGSSSLPEHLSWDIVTSAPADIARLLKVLPGAAEVVLALRLQGAASMAASKPLTSGFKRVVLTRALPGQEARVDALFEVVGRSTDIIKNWRVSRIDPASDPAGWTHAFEMEFESLAEMAGPYRSSPYHWAITDSPFHPETPNRAGAGFLNCIYPIQRSYLCQV
jgi:hypothetical protein